MRNILAIAQKELRAYFASPIAYIVIGFFALLYGIFFVAILNYFVSASMQAGLTGGAQSMNVNQQLVRPLLQNVAVVVLFMLPMVTMRTYAEEKRSGTIELLLTSPITDFQIVMGKFFGAMALYCAMLAVTLFHLAVLYMYGRPEWKPILTSYVGLLLFGGSFVALGLFVSSLSKNQIVAGAVTFALSLMLWIITWLNFGASASDKVLGYLSIIDHLDDFSKGVIDTTHVIYYLSFITFGLFLTAKSVDSERWRG
ncbi:MAG TPA: ABC transporter permease [Vicinamibacterales bacterium]|nr:ABC transporter permease [Vicinamibacterales bacterium]